MAEHVRRERFGAGQGHPTGWTLEQLDEGWHGMDFAHVAVCCLRDLVSEVIAERCAHEETRDKYRAALDEYDRARVAKADRC